jgi:hypothetical protein
VKTLKTILVITILVTILSTGSVAFAQEYKLHISNIRIPDQQEKTWYGRPLTSDFVVSWELYTLDEQGKPQLANAQEKSIISEYIVYLSPGDSTFSKTVKQQVISKEMAASGVDSTTFAKNKVSSQPYYFRVEGITNTNTSIKSDTASAVSGYLAAQSSPKAPAEGKNYYIPLFFPLDEILGLFNIHNPVYDDSTFLGKWAFCMLWYFAFIGIYFIVRKGGPTLYFMRLFPMLKAGFIQAHWKKEQVYGENLAPRFQFFIEAWRNVARLTTKSVKEKSASHTGDIDQSYYNFFEEYGLGALEVLKKFINFDAQKDDRTWMETEITAYFGPDGKFGDFISKPFKVTIGNNSYLNWDDVKKDLYNPLSKPLADYSTIKILEAGLDNHIINGYHWSDVSAEVERAMENRASSEVESLKEKSEIEWIWNLGAIAPLLGLFGTITGITSVFELIGAMDPSTTQLQLIRSLSSGIFEALWTTIYGLVIGITFMLIYYYYKNSVEWIYNRWQQIFVHVTESL